MDRAIFNLSFTKEHVPKWPCPACGSGHLTLVPESLVHLESQSSLAERDHDAWDPDWIRYVFSCMFVCSDGSCKEVVSCCGAGQVDYFEHEDEHERVQFMDDRFTPKFFHPPLIMMDIPKECPAEATTHLSESFAMYFADPGAALNSARAALEAVLTSMGIKRFDLVKGKRRIVNLHQRIQLLPPKFDEIKELLQAVKWLGNAGSHDGEALTAGDVRTTYDFLEHALSEIYEAKSKKLKALAKKVNKKKGPVK